MEKEGESERVIETGWKMKNIESVHGPNAIINNNSYNGVDIGGMVKQQQ